MTKVEQVKTAIREDAALSCCLSASNRDGQFFSI
jgi:hypothetical protein